uniref:Uncharacterized protein n=1 Tax=Avena sativa TaxID=4498 RepID=A0ACD6AKE0_AVESA
MSAAGHGRCSSRSASSIVAREVKGFHLLRIDGYSETKKLLPGHKLSSQPFIIGGYSWSIDYYPNGRDASASSNAISVYLQLTNQTTTQRLLLQAQYKFSLLDHAGVDAYELPAVTGSFTSAPLAIPHANSYYQHHRNASGLRDGGDEAEPGPGCGHERCITTAELERRREHLIRDDTIVLRCDVTVTQIDASWLMVHGQVDPMDFEDEDEEDLEEEEGYGSPGYSAPRRRRPHHHRPDDREYIKRCLTQRPGRGGRYR